MSFDIDDLTPGASNVNDAYADGSISREQAKRLVDEMLAEDAPSSTPPPSTGRGGPPQGYGKWGDLA